MAKCPDTWVEGIPLPTNPTNFDPEWRQENFVHQWMYHDLMKMFDEKGVEYFEGLEIWHIPQLARRFEDEAEKTFFKCLPIISKQNKKELQSASYSLKGFKWNLKIQNGLLFIEGFLIKKTTVMIIDQV